LLRFQITSKASKILNNVKCLTKVKGDPAMNSFVQITHEFAQSVEPSTELNFQSLLFENDFKAVFPELFLVLASLFLLIYGVVWTTSASTGYPLLLRNVNWLALLTLLLTAMIAANSPIGHGVFFYHTFLLDDVTFFFKMLVVVGALSSLLISLDYLERESVNGFEFALLLLLSTSSMLFLISAADFISMYLAIELQSLCFYVLAAFKRDSEFSTEAGLKYFLLGVFSSGLLLFGCSLIYGFTGVIEFSELSKVFASLASSGEVYSDKVDLVQASQAFGASLEGSPLQPPSAGGGDGHLAGGGSLVSTSSWRGCELGMIFLLIGFLFKLTAVPFHMWAPDVYEGAPTAVTAFFSITPKPALLVVFARLLYQSFYDFMIEWQTFLIFCSVASMVLGSFAGLAQHRIKRLLAYSSIGHVGYLLISFCCGTLEGLQGLAIYLVIYIVVTVNIFAVVMTPLRRASHSAQQQQGVERIKYTTDLAMLAKNNPLLAATLTVSVFSLAGIPPLAGFYGKAFLFWAALSSSQYLLALVGILTSAISCFYYIRIVKIMYFEAPQNWLSFSRLSKESSLVLALTTFFVVALMAYPYPLYVASHKVALALSM
jgi:NADH:ubiquinone oxidoreductase subunit 2 (subunit N)